MKVRATQLGFYRLVRRRPGDIFELKPVKGVKMDRQGNRTPYVFSAEEQFSPRWMEKVEDTLAADSADQEQQEGDEELAEIARVAAERSQEKRTKKGTGDKAVI
jgi:hypothetical protein